MLTRAAAKAVLGILITDIPLIDVAA